MAGLVIVSEPAKKAGGKGDLKKTDKTIKHEFESEDPLYKGDKFTCFDNGIEIFWNRKGKIHLVYTDYSFKKAKLLAKKGFITHTKSNSTGKEYLRYLAEAKETHKEYGEKLKNGELL